MNEKITFPRLASMLADRSGRSKRFSEDFLREFFSLISDRLESGESVKVKGLGTFKLSRVEPRRSVDVTTGKPMEISGHTKVVFVPAKELAEAVNSPFEAFTAIEISDATDISQLFAEDEIVLKDEGDDIAEESKEKATSFEAILKEGEAPISETEELELTSEHAEVGREMEQPAESEEESEEEQMSDCEEEEEIYGETSSEKRGWLRILMISLGAAMIALIATLAVWYIFATDNFNRVFQKPLSYLQASSTKKNTDASTAKELPTVLTASCNETEKTDTDTLQSKEEAPEVPTAPSDAIVYDTIGTTRYLTTMAKSHYGNYNLWPYIYEENKNFLGHPDRIRPGTPVVIPKLSKYGIDPTNEEDIEKAKKMGIEIYARYGKKIQ